MITNKQQTDPFSYGSTSEMTFDGLSLTSLANKYGTPLQIYSANTILQNISAMKEILLAAWGEKHNIKYSIKSTGLRKIADLCVEAGCGLECFGSGELNIALATGISPSRILLNGSAKNELVLSQARSAGVTISIDNLADVEKLLAQSNQDLAGINFYIRAKLVPTVKDQLPPGAAEDLVNLITFAKEEKWGASIPLATQIYEAMTNAGAQFQGINVHLGRVLKQDWSFAYWGTLFGKYLAEFNRITGASPNYLDIGGGWTRSRDPMPSALQLRMPAELGLPEFTNAMKAELPKFDHLPTLEVETGRFIVGNSAVAISKVINRKQDFDITWLHLDISTNFLLRIDTSKYQYAILPVIATEPSGRTARLVGETCVDSNISTNFNYPNLKNDDLVAILDTGMYTVSTANNFNSIPKPIVLINTINHGLEEIKI